MRMLTIYHIKKYHLNLPLLEDVTQEVTGCSVATSPIPSKLSTR
jgi:hypothetical protein